MVNQLTTVLTGVNPARAGMILMMNTEYIAWARKPRASGDDPAAADLERKIWS